MATKAETIRTFTCDGCGKEHYMNNKCKDERPFGWFRITIETYPPTGTTVLDLCPECGIATCIDIMGED